MVRSRVSLRYCHYDFASHKLSFDVRITVVLACQVVAVVGRRFVWRELFEEDFVVVMQTAFIIVDEDRCRYVHRVDERQTF